MFFVKLKLSSRHLRVWLPYYTVDLDLVAIVGNEFEVWLAMTFDSICLMSATSAEVDWAKGVIYIWHFCIERNRIVMSEEYSPLFLWFAHNSHSRNIYIGKLFSMLMRISGYHEIIVRKKVAFFSWGLCASFDTNLETVAPFNTAGDFQGIVHFCQNWPNLGFLIGTHRFLGRSSLG